MTPIPNCPICNKDLIVEPTTCVGGCIAEAYEHCSEEHYYYGYAYGGTQYIIGDKTFGWHYTDSTKEKREIRNKIDKTIKN